MEKLNIYFRFIVKHVWFQNSNSITFDFRILVLLIIAERSIMKLMLIVVK